MPECTIFWRGQQISPPRIFCIGKNYADHVKELGDEMIEELVVFMKPPESITDILRSEDGEVLHYEGEISLLIEGGKVAGVGFGLDLTKRALQRHLKKRGLPWELCKAFRGSALFSEFVPLEVPVETLEVVLKVDGSAIQHGRVSDMIHCPDSIIKGLEAFHQLKDGDVIMTGTPKGVGPLERGKVYCGSILSKGAELVSGEWNCS